MDSRGPLIFLKYCSCFKECQVAFIHLKNEERHTLASCFCDDYVAEYHLENCAIVALRDITYVSHAYFCVGYVTSLSYTHADLFCVCRRMNF